METLPNLSNDQQIALLGAIKNICEIFRGPDAGTCKKMILGTFFDSFDTLAGMINESFALNLQKIKSCARSLQEGNRLHQHLEEAFIRLFINTKGGIKTPLYQSCYEYENAPLMGKAAIEMKKKFESRGLAVSGEIHEPPAFALLISIRKKGSRRKPGCCPNRLPRRDRLRLFSESIRI